MKKISNEQIKAVIQGFYDLNAPVKLYEGVVKMLTELPSIEQVEVKEETQELDKIE